MTPHTRANRRPRRPQMAADGRKSGAVATARRPTPCANRRFWRSCPSRQSGRPRPAAALAEQTLRRWLTEDAAFQAEYEAARHATFQAAIRRIPALTGRAVETLADLLGTSTHPAVRLFVVLYLRPSGRFLLAGTGGATSERR